MISRAGDAREDVPQSAIQEFKVIVSQSPAEYGGRVGGVVNVVTKGGGNQVRGEAFEFFRNKNLNRVDLYTQQNHDQLGTPIPDFSRNQFGGAVGGPPHVVERFEFTDANTLNYRATIEDPAVYTRPWTIASRFVRGKRGQG